MLFKEINVPVSNALDLSRFKEMDYYAVENYTLPVELMMENAGLQLANLVASSTENNDAKILIGVGNGNNGGGGLVAARRLTAWGYQVYLDFFTDINKDLPKRQLERTIKFGTKKEGLAHPDIWVDAYLGFLQRLPLAKNLLDTIKEANQCDCLKISLDIPTGFLGDISVPYFQADKVLSLVASKKMLYNLSQRTELFIADLGIPQIVYQKFGIESPPFSANNILRINRGSFA